MISISQKESRINIKTWILNLKTREATATPVDVAGKYWGEEEQISHQGFSSTWKTETTIVDNVKIEIEKIFEIQIKDCWNWKEFWDLNQRILKLERIF